MYLFGNRRNNRVIDETYNISLFRDSKAQYTVAQAVLERWFKVLGFDTGLQISQRAPIAPIWMDFYIPTQLMCSSAPFRRVPVIAAFTIGSHFLNRTCGWPTPA